MRDGFLAPRRFSERAFSLTIFAVAALFSVGYVLWVGRGQTLILDEWSYLIESRGWSASTLLTPHNGHLILFPLLVLKAMYATFGISSHLPYQLLAVMLNVAVATFVYTFARRRVGALTALAPGVLILFYGAGWDAFVTAYQLPNLIGLSAGLGALIAIDRRDLRSDLLACLLLAVSLASFTIGVAFTAGLVVALLLRGRRQAINRAWVVLAPGVLYLAWFVWARKFHETDITAYNVGALLSGIADQVSAVLSGITGLFTTPGTTELSTMISARTVWGPVLVAAVLAVAIVRFRRKPPTAIFWVVATVLIVYLALVALNLGPGRAPGEGRYVYLGSVLTLVVLAELANGVTVNRVWGVVLIGTLGLSLLANGAALGAGGRLVRLEASTNRAELGALEIARNRVAGVFFVEPLGQEIMSNPDMLFDAKTYFEVSKSFGTPAYSEGQIEGSIEQAREAADLLFARALPISVFPIAHLSHPGEGIVRAESIATGSAGNRGRCLRVTPVSRRQAQLSIAVPPGGIAYRAPRDQQPEIKLRRFAEAFAVVPPLIAGTAEIRVPTDGSRKPWEAEILTPVALKICPR
jgi:hypothetical protein